MDDEAKNFFEKLSGVKPGAEDEPILVESEEEEVLDITDESEGQLAVDVYETPTSFVVKSAIAGVNEESIDISASADSVTIKGKRENDNHLKDDQYLHRECFWGKFSRSIILPQEIDPDKTQASLKSGVLKITLPKLNKTKSKKLKVKFE